ncbi:MAG TPA: SAM-dependent chlorinase/fluorinase [Tenuifilaceae bacterium]|nr:SAM-dependent chlorinase/fluorinase [Tenuifilaceae bacterium]
MLIFNIPDYSITFVMLLANPMDNLRIVTLTTDWNQNDYYVGILCGRLLSIEPTLRIVELSHRVPPFDYIQAAFIMRGCFENFPPGTIHICMVNSDSTTSKQLLLFELKGHFMIVPDNGIVGLITEVAPDRVYSIPFEEHSSFGSLSAVASAMNMLLFNSNLADIALMAGTYKQNINIRAASDESSITGSVIYVDSYQNAITNITREQFEQVRKGRKFSIYVQSFSYKIEEIVENYADVEDGDMLALFNSLNLLEIAIRNGFLTELLALSVGSSIMVKFTNR